VTIKQSGYKSARLATSTAIKDVDEVRECIEEVCNETGRNEPGRYRRYGNWTTRGFADAVGLLVVFIA